MERTKTIEQLSCMGIVSLGITAIRVILAIFSAISIIDIQEPMKMLVFLIICIMLLDQLDGVLFNKSNLNNIYKWKFRRRVFDSCSDRLCIQLFCLPILITDNSFFLPYLAILIKEILTSSVCIKAYCDGILLTSNIMGKLSSVLVGLIVVFWILDLKSTMHLLIPMVIIFGVIAYNKYSSNCH